VDNTDERKFAQFHQQSGYNTFHLNANLRSPLQCCMPGAEICLLRNDQLIIIRWMNRCQTGCHRTQRWCGRYWRKDEHSRNPLIDDVSILYLARVWNTNALVTGTDVDRLIFI